MLCVGELLCVFGVRGFSAAAPNVAASRSRGAFFFIHDYVDERRRADETTRRRLRMWNAGSTGTLRSDSAGYTYPLREILTELNKNRSWHSRISASQSTESWGDRTVMEEPEFVSNRGPGGITEWQASLWSSEPACLATRVRVWVEGRFCEKTLCTECITRSGRLINSTAEAWKDIQDWQHDEMHLTGSQKFAK